MPKPKVQPQYCLSILSGVICNTLGTKSVSSCWFTSSTFSKTKNIGFRGYRGIKNLEVSLIFEMRITAQNDLGKPTL